MICSDILKQEEKAAFRLRSLYRSFGYLPYKMSKFEEYEYYIRNKDFLVSDRFITFNDTNGKLMALKPDVTLSIIKNCQPVPGCKQKVCYDENIYRPSQSSRQFKEIRQAGLECIGDIDLYDIFEVVTLAARSLEMLGQDYVLQISHLGILSQLLASTCSDTGFHQAAISCIAQKNEHDLLRLCQRWQVAPEKQEQLCRFLGLYGSPRTVLEQLQSLGGGLAENALSELAQLSQLLESTPFAHKIHLDFSVVNNMNYYDGIVFTGFLSGISGSILAGGQYGKLMRKLGCSANAIGFALYLDLLEQRPAPGQGYDVDVLLVYGENTDPGTVARQVADLTAEGKTVSAQRSIPPKLRYRQLIRLEKEGVSC